MEFVEETHEELLEYTSTVASLLNSHSGTEYSSDLHTVDIADRDNRIEERLTYTSRIAQEALKKMDSALQSLREEAENPGRNSLREELNWYRDRYLKLEEELRNAEQTDVLGETMGRRSYERADFELNEEIEEFEVDTGEPAPSIKQ